MKAKLNKAPVAFEPLEITITLESQAEVQAVYWMANNGNMLAAHLGNVAERSEPKTAPNEQDATEHVRFMLKRVFDALYNHGVRQA